jgi:hypothetical protein
MSLAALGLSALGQAAIVNCVTNQSTVPATATTATTVVNCPGLTTGDIGVGNTLTLVTLIVRGSFNDSAINPPYSGQVQFDFTENSAQFVIATISGLAPPGLGNTNSVGSTGNLTGASNALSLTSLNAFTVSALETLLAGGRLPSDSNVSVSYDYTVTVPTPPTPGIPEPSTYALIGLGLSALAFARHRS